VSRKNIEKYAPPNNRAPTAEEIAACKPLLLRQLTRVDPDVVVLLGRVAQRAVSGEAVLRGRHVLTTVHPAAAMRFPWMGRRFRRDLRTLKRWFAA
jgi:DNA polymerase